MKMILVPLFVALLLGTEKIIDDKSTDTSFGTDEEGTVLKHANLCQLISGSSDDQLQKVEEFIEKNAMSPNYQDEFEWTPLMNAIALKKWDIAEFLAEVPGHGINLQRADGWTALHDLVLFGRDAIIEKLLQREDIDFSLETKSGLTALQLAKLKLRYANECSILLTKPTEKALKRLDTLFKKFGGKAVENLKLNTIAKKKQENSAKMYRIMRNCVVSSIVLVPILTSIFYSNADSGPIGVSDLSVVSLLENLGCSVPFYDSLKYSILAFAARGIPPFGNLAASCDYLENNISKLSKQQQVDELESRKLCQRHKTLRKIRYPYENYYLSNNGQQLIYDNRHLNHNLRKVFRYDLDSIPVLFRYKGKDFTLIDINRNTLTFDLNDGAMRVAITFKNIFNRQNVNDKNHIYVNFNKIEDFVIEQYKYSENGNESNRNYFENFMGKCVAKVENCNFEKNQILPLIFLATQNILK